MDLVSNVKPLLKTMCGINIRKNNDGSKEAFLPLLVPYKNKPNTTPQNMYMPVSVTSLKRLNKCAENSAVISPNIITINVVFVITFCLLTLHFDWYKLTKSTQDCFGNKRLPSGHILFAIKSST